MGDTEKNLLCYFFSANFAIETPSVSVIQSSIQQSSSRGANLFTHAAGPNNVHTKILQHTSTASTTSNVGAVTTTPTTQIYIKHYTSKTTGQTTAGNGEFIPSSQFIPLTSTQTDGVTSGVYTSSESTSIVTPDSKGIAMSTQPILTHTENIHTSATTRVVKSRETLKQSQLIAMLTPSESTNVMKGRSSATSLSEQTVSPTHTRHLYTNIEIHTGYDQSTLISSTSVQLSTYASSTSVQQLSTPTTNPTGWKLPISRSVIEMIAAAVVVVIVGVLVVVTVTIAVCW